MAEVVDSAKVGVERLAAEAGVSLAVTVHELKTSQMAVEASHMPDLASGQKPGVHADSHS